MFQIARELRLRDIGGIIVVDFIDMADDCKLVSLPLSLSPLSWSGQDGGWRTFGLQCQLLENFVNE